MKAFLSHSSQDKYFVRGVAKGLGNLQIEYDEYTFEYQLNAEAIRRALGQMSPVMNLLLPCYQAVWSFP